VESVAEHVVPANLYKVIDLSPWSVGVLKALSTGLLEPVDGNVWKN
jgi:hypothetical protein